MNFCISGSFASVTIWVPCREPNPSRRDLKLPPACRQVGKNMQVGVVDAVEKTPGDVDTVNKKCKGFGVERGFFQKRPLQSVSSHILKWACSPLWWQQQATCRILSPGHMKLYIYLWGTDISPSLGLKLHYYCVIRAWESREAQMMQWSTWPQCVRPRLWTRGEWGDDGSHGDQSGIEEQGTMKALDKEKKSKVDLEK